MSNKKKALIPISRLAASIITIIVLVAGGDYYLHPIWDDSVSFRHSIELTDKARSYLSNQKVRSFEYGKNRMCIAYFPEAGVEDLCIPIQNTGFQSERPIFEVKHRWNGWVAYSTNPELLESGLYSHADTVKLVEEKVVLSHPVIVKAMNSYGSWFDRKQIWSQL